MKFKAKITDLKLELTTLKDGPLKGIDVVKDVSRSISATQAAMLLKKIDDDDRETRRKFSKDPDKAMEAMCQMFADMYGEEPSWWGDNFTTGLLLEAKDWIIFQLMGVKKNA